MSYRLRIVEEAYRDIRRNADWWAEHHSAAQAEKWADAIWGKIRALDEFPESCSFAYENEDFPYELREALFGLGSQPGNRILFTIQNKDVIVLGVRAAEHDWLRKGDLPPFPPSDK
ncbi:MAG: type II toxin-antitoxin system RelE/ParE family toxin [Planctomycetaceae bacterium]|nr:type II toxin-antitoxin system RelE/ParE family toxin [Planctomycetaceae bacterium]